MSLDALEPNAKLSEERAPQRPRTQAVRRTVLIVEDDPHSRELLVEMLDAWGYDVVPVGSAEEAEYAMRRKRIDAAVVDVFLPGKSGASLLSRLRNRFPEAVVIGTSAMSDAAMARKCKGLGADLFLGKPLDPQRLAQALQAPHQSWH